MPRYCIISEVDLGRGHREPRGKHLGLDEERRITFVKSDSLVEAIEIALDRYRLRPPTGQHRERRIVSVEEVHPGFSYSDVEITEAIATPEGNLFADEPLLDRSRFDSDTEPLYLSTDFTDAVANVVVALRESNLVPGLNISVLANEPDDPYAMIEIFDETRKIYLSRGVEVRKITDNREAIGWDGVLAIAQELLNISNDLH